jgi:hypothetical protein
MVTAVVTVKIGLRGAFVHTCLFALSPEPSVYTFRFSEKPLTI